jgi:3-oxoacyl-(acyl-carrier-protein) synthase
LSFELIRGGRVDAMFTGGVEAAVTPIGIAAFDRMRALSHRNDDPSRASRPFDADRDGFVMAEGGAILVLEELEYALDRGAEPLAEVLAYSATSDASHLSAPDLYGESAAECMRMALGYAELAPADIDYLNAHGTSTPAGDLAETRAIKSVFGPAVYNLAISSTKSITGHMLAGAGSFEAMVCVLALRTGVIPGTINLDQPGEECDLDYVAHTARKMPIRCALSNSMGFGGHNSALIFKKWG